MLRIVRDECSYDSGRRLRCKQCKGFVCPSASPVASRGVRAADWCKVYQKDSRQGKRKARVRAPMRRRRALTYHTDGSAEI